MIIVKRREGVFMSITVEWFDTDERIILLTTSKGWTTDELESAVAETRKMSGGVSHHKLVHAIMDMRKGSSVPRNIATRFRKIADTQLPNAGATVIVANSGFIHSLFNLITRLSPGNIMFKIEKYFSVVSTFEDAERRVQTLINNEDSVAS